MKVEWKAKEKEIKFFLGKEGKMIIKNRRNDKTAESLETVHTHTHTQAILPKGQKLSTRRE